MFNVLVLWSHHSGYLHCCLQELSRHAAVTAVFFETSQIAPFAKSYFDDANYNIVWIDPASLFVFDQLNTCLSSFSFDLCLCSGWHHRMYIRYLSRCLNSKCIRVLCFDWQWSPTLRNHLKAAYGSLFRSQIFDVCFVGGERQYQFARRIGFSSDSIYQGIFSGASQAFYLAPWSERLDRVVFVGRLVESKGCRQLAAAWHILNKRGLIPRSWSLAVFGVGPLDYLFAGLESCDVYGFQQPDVIARVLGQSKILCAPSIKEPWGVQIHEATLAGLAVLATDACGSAVHLVRSGFNGDIVRPGDSSSLSSALRRLIKLDEPVNGTLEGYGSCSKILSKQFSPALWVATLKRILSDA